MKTDTEYDALKAEYECFQRRLATETEEHATTKKLRDHLESLLGQIEREHECDFSKTCPVCLILQTPNP